MKYMVGVPAGEKYLSLPLICGLAKISGLILLRFFFFLTKVSDVLSVNGTSKVGCEEYKKDISMNSVLYWGGWKVK